MMLFFAGSPLRAVPLIHVAALTNAIASLVLSAVRGAQLGWGGLFPFEWKSPSADLKSFAAMKVRGFGATADCCLVSTEVIR